MTVTKIINGKLVLEPASERYRREFWGDYPAKPADTRTLREIHDARELEHAPGCRSGNCAGCATACTDCGLVADHSMGCRVANAGKVC